MSGVLFRSRQSSFQPQDQAVKKAELSREPRQLIEKDQTAYEEKQRPTKEFDGVEMFSEALVETQKLANAESGEQKRHGEPGGIDSEEQHAAGDGVAGSGEGQDGCEDRADARRPAESECEAEKEAAPSAGLRAGAAEMHVAVEPAGERGTEKADDREREKMYRAEAGEKCVVAEQSGETEKDENSTENEARAKVEFYQGSEKMKAEENNQRAGDGREERAILSKESADSASGSAERNKDERKTRDEGKRGSKKAAARWLALAQLLHADAGEHGNVAGDQRKNARREERNESGEESGG